MVRNVASLPAAAPAPAPVASQVRRPRPARVDTGRYVLSVAAAARAAVRPPIRNINI